MGVHVNMCNKKSIALLLLTAICLSSISCMSSCTYFINYLFGPRNTSQYRLPSDYDKTDYILESEDVIIKLAVYDYTTLIGFLIHGDEKVNISIKYELFGTAYEYNTAKIYNTDTNEYIDYVLIECNGKKLRLTAKIEENYNPQVLDGIKKEQSIFLLFDTDSVELNAVP